MRIHRYVKPSTCSKFFHIISHAVIFAQQTVKCPPGQIPVFVNNTPVIDPVTGQPQCSPITGLDPLGSIFGR